MIDDADLLALCGFEEANLEPDDGLAAVIRVALNRTRLRYESNGAIASTIFWPNAFSWTQWAMVRGHYTKIAHTPAEIEARAAALLASAQDYRAAWARAVRIAGAVQAGTYDGPAYGQVTDATVLYLDPAISAASWAIPAKRVCVIGRHAFFHA